MRYVVPFLIGILIAYFLPQLTPFTIPLLWMCGAMGVLVFLLILFHHWKAVNTFGYATTLFCMVLGIVAFEHLVYLAVNAFYAGADNALGELI